MMHTIAAAPMEMNLSLARITLAHSATSGNAQVKAKG